MKRVFSSLLLILLLCSCQETSAELENAAASDIPGYSAAEGRSSPDRPFSLAGEETVVSIPRTPATASFFLTCWDGKTLWKQSCFTQEDRDALAEALPSVCGYAITEETSPIPEDTPIYGLSLGGAEENFEAVCCGTIWLDNAGHLLRLRSEPALPDLWARFAQNPEEQDLRSQPAHWELALSSGQWDPRFLVPADCPVSEAVPMALTVTDNGMEWRITNGLREEITHGNDSTAFPEVLLDGIWYQLPVRSGKHYAWTAEAYTTHPGESYSGRLWQEPYGPLPPGNYRLVFRFSAGSPAEGCATAPFQVTDRGPQLAHNS
ncbi:MAG: hypothetical protein HFG00_05995 [Oscillibacter sp.]|nr:hypothetical protein [Oscillibacter sp.]